MKTVNVELIQKTITEFTAMIQARANLRECAFYALQHHVSMDTNIVLATREAVEIDALLPICKSPVDLTINRKMSEKRWSVVEQLKQFKETFKQLHETANLEMGV